MTTYDLSPIGGELFAGRDARRALVPTDAFQKLTKLEAEMKAPGFAEMQLDRHASALWLSSKLQRPAPEVLQNFDAYARAYWGKDVTPGQAYDRIVEYERQTMQMAAPAPQAGAKDPAKGGEAGKDENAAKGWQFMRAAGAGFAKAGHDTAGGTLAMVEGAMNTLGGMPDRKGVSEDPAFSDALFKLGVMEYDGTLDTPEGAMVRAQVDAGRARLDEDFKARMAEYRATVRGSLAADVRAGADFFYELGEESAKFYGVSEEYRASTMGKVAEAGGSMVASSALLAAGSLGFLGKVKGAATVMKRVADVAGAGQIYAGVEQDRMAVEGDAYRNTGWTFAANLANAGVQQYIERWPLLDNTLERAIKHVPHKGGVVKMGDVLREMNREAVRSGMVEATEEVIQGAWDDFISDMAYDDMRVDLSDGKMDYLKRRAGEALAGFGGGVMLGGTFGGGAIFDRNQAAKKAERAFASRAGEMLTPEDFGHLRRARTDEQIKAMPNGETLLAAANGDMAAMQAYNRAVFDASFVRTDGLVAFGDEIGEYKGMPAVRLADGRRVPINMADPEQVARFNAFRRQVAAAASGDAAVAEFQKRFGEGLTTERPPAAPSLQDMVEAGTLTPEQAEDARRVAVAMKKVAEGTALADLYPEGSARAVEDSKTKLVRMVTQVLQGKNAAVAIEETSEAWIQAAVKKGDVDRGELRTLRMDWQQTNGEAPAEGVSEERADIEWFSRRVIEYALAGKHTEVTGSKWWQWIRTLGEQLRDVLKGAQKMREAMKAGTLDPRLEGWFKAALGVEKLGEQMSPERAQRQADLEAAFAELPPESVLRFQEAEQRLRDYELLKADYRRQELEAAKRGDEAIAEGLQDRMRALDFERAKAEEAIDNALALPDSVQLSPQAQRMLDEWETFSLAQVNPDSVLPGPGSFSLTNTPAFKKWFGKSVVVDEDGKPLAVYRGEWGGDPAQNSFANTQLGLPTFTDAKALAEVYANDGEGGRVREVYLAIQNPLRFGESDGVVNKAEFKKLAKALKLTAAESADLVSAGGWVVDGEPQSFDNIKAVPAGAYVEAPTLADTAFIQERAKALGFDGIIIRGIFTADVEPVGSFDGVTALEYRPFSMDQVKEGRVEKREKADANPAWTPEMLADFEKKRAASAASSLLSSLRIEGGIGIVTSTGEVRVSPFKSAADLIEKNHANVFGDIGGSDRFRYDAMTNSLVWTAEPSLESREAAVNYLTRRGAFVATEETGAGQQLPPLFGGPSFSVGASGPGGQGELPLEYQAARRKVEDTWEKWMQSQGYAELVRMRDESYVSSLVTARAKHDSMSMAGLESVISPVYEAIRRAGAPEVSAALVRNTQQAAQRKERDRRVVRALAEKMQRLDEGVAYAFDLARLNGDLANMQSMAARYGFRAEMDGVLAMFDRIRQEALVAGVPVGTFWEQPEEVTKEAKAAIKAAGRDGAALEQALKAAGYRLRIETYWPRHVIDHDEYLAYLTKTAPNSSALARAYQAALVKAAGRPLTSDELDLVASKGVAELKRRDIRGGGKPSALKRRTVEQVDMEAVRFYKKPIDSAYSHVERMHDYVAMLSFFGDKARVDDPAVDGALPVLNVKDTLENYLKAQRELLKPAQVDAIRSALQARFSYVGSPSIINTVKTLGYLQGMTQLYTPLTAVFPDMWSIALESNANLSTFVSAIYQASTGESAADLSSFGLNAREMHREFQTQMGGRLSRAVADRLKLKGKTRATVEAITLANTLDSILRVLGLNKFNDFVQRSRANAELIALRKAAEAGQLSRIQQSRIERFFLPAERQQLLADVAAGKGVEESDLVASYVWAGLADYMPISLDQMPEQYLKNPKGRIFYMYKTFLVMQTAAIRRESIDSIVEGVKKKDAKLVAYGVGTLLAMVSLLLAFSMPPDMVRAYLQNRSYVAEDELVWKLMGLVGVSHFVAQKMQQDATGAAAAYFAPPTSIIPDAIRDAEDIWDGKLTGDVDGFDFSKLRIWNYTPIIGRTYQGWFGSDSEKRQKELEAAEWFRMRADPTKKEASEAARRRWLLERYGKE